MVSDDEEAGFEVRTTFGSSKKEDKKPEPEKAKSRKQPPKKEAVEPAGRLGTKGEGGEYIKRDGVLYRS